MFSRIIVIALLIPSLGWATSALEPSRDPKTIVSEGTLKNGLPYYDEIMKIMEPLEYSGFQVVVKPEVTLSIDFDKRSWTLHNMHQYDAQGRIVLEQNRYGLCAELSTFVFDRLVPIISSRYELKIAKVYEEEFFSIQQSNHITLLMHDKEDQRTYLIDPSFHSYGMVENFSKYTIKSIQGLLTFTKEKSKNDSFLVNEAMPLFIKNDLLASFSVTSVDGKFDKENFLFALSVNQRNKFFGLNIVVFGKYNGKLESFENKVFLEKLLSQSQRDLLNKKLREWLLQIQSKT